MSKGCYSFLRFNQRLKSPEQLSHLVPVSCVVQKQIGFITGNEDMHLKNFSIINRNNIIGISPCYDLLNTTIELKDASEEIALTLQGKRNNLTKQMLIEYFGGERLNLVYTSCSLKPEFTG